MTLKRRQINSLSLETATRYSLFIEDMCRRAIADDGLSEATPDQIAIEILHGITMADLQGGSIVAYIHALKATNHD